MYHDERRHRGGICSALFTILVIAGIAIGLYYWLFANRVPKQVVLEADFGHGVVEMVPDDSLGRVLLSKRLTLRDIVEALQKASADDRVKGLIAKVGQSNIRLAQVQEIRDAVIAFRKAGKPAIAYSETFGEFGPGNSAYYLATAFDAIYLQPSGDLGLTGLIYEQPFIKGTLDKLGIVPRIDGRKEFKSFRYMFTERKYNAPHREEITSVMNSQFSQVVRGIAEARKLSDEEVRELINKGPFIGREAVDAKLVDTLAYRDEVYDKIKEKTGVKENFLSLAEYRKRAGGVNEKGTTVALIYGVGGISRGKNGYNPATGEMVMGSDTVAAAIRSAVEDSNVKAILFRIDSPGGSYVASDTIWREVVKAKKAGKPVIVSMGSVAGSGGYFVAMAADKIVAQPATITGSIGVFGGKMVTTGFWNKLGVSWDEVHTSRNGDAWTGARDLTPAERAKMEAWLNRVYADFTSKVGEGRKLAPEAVEKIAKGRIWTGAQGKELGLVDELGGFPTALRLVRKAAKLDDNAPIRLRVYPEQKTLVKLISEMRHAAGADEEPFALARTLEDLQPVVKTLQSLGFSSQVDVLKMPEVE